MTREERVAKIDEVLKRFANGDLKPLAIKFMGHLVNDEGVALINDIVYYWGGIDNNDRIAIITIIRSSVFDFNMTRGWNTACPPTSETIAQFWDEATDVVDGVSPLYIDTVDTQCRRYENGRFQYTHRILNCSIDHVYELELPYVYWWLPTNDEAQNNF